MSRTLVNCKEAIRVGCWNVTSLNDDMRQQSVLNEFVRYKLDILALSETRLTGNGESTLSNGAISRTLLYSGDNQRHIYGVGFLLSQKASESLLAFRAVSDRICVADFRATTGTASVISVYAPTESSSDSDKDDFYDSLNDVISSLPRGNIVMICGDLNAHIGKHTGARNRVVGQFGVGDLNDNGVRLLSFSSAHDLSITNTFFDYRDINTYLHVA